MNDNQEEDAEEQKNEKGLVRGKVTCDRGRETN